MSYTLEVQPPAEKDFDGLPREVQAQVAARLRALCEDPRPPGTVPVKNAPKGCYRSRVGDYRIGYHVDDKGRHISVWGIATRGTFYKVAERRVLLT